MMKRRGGKTTTRRADSKILIDNSLDHKNNHPVLGIPAFMRFF